MSTIKYSDSAKCPKCGGLLIYDARMTERECQADARARGATAFFESRITPKVGPLSDDLKAAGQSQFQAEDINPLAC